MKIIHDGSVFLELKLDKFYKKRVKKIFRKLLLHKRISTLQIKRTLAKFNKFIEIEKLGLLIVYNDSSEVCRWGIGNIELADNKNGLYKFEIEVPFFKQRRDRLNYIIIKVLKHYLMTERKCSDCRFNCQDFANVYPEGYCKNPRSDYYQTPSLKQIKEDEIANCFEPNYVSKSD